MVRRIFVERKAGLDTEARALREELRNILGVTGLERLRELAAPGATIAFVGSSGAGKSTLINTLAGEELAAVREVQEWSGRGRHTTTSRRLYMLPSGAMAIDTPGVREIGMVGEVDAVLAKGASTHRWRMQAR